MANYTRRINLYINGTEVRNNISGITERMRQLRNEQSKLTIGTDEYNRKAREIRHLQGILNQHRLSLKATGGFWEKLQTGVMRYTRLMSVMFATIVGGGFSISRVISQFNEFEESLKNLSSLTGLTGEELKYLEQRAKELSTSITENGIRITQSAKEILNAYTIVGSQRPELLKNKEALADVTEASLILAAAGKMELAPAARAVTGAMNQMNLPASEAGRIINVMAAGAQAGAAGIDYLTSVIERAGTPAHALGLTYEQLVATVETIAPKFTASSDAATQLRNIFLILAAGADEFNPAIVGMDQALENLAARQLSVKELTEMFGMVNINAAKTLIDNRAELIRYTEAVTGTSKAIEMAAINTDTNTAKLQQARNELALISITLGSQLSPAVASGISSLAGLLKVMLQTGKFFYDNRRAIITVTSAIVAYSIAVNLATIATRIQTTAMLLAAKAQAIWTATTKLHPWALVVAGIAAAATALALYSRRLTDVEKAERSLNEAKQAAEKQISRTRVELNQLFKIAQDENRSLEQRRKAIFEINRISPEYLGNINLETIHTNKAKEAKEEYIKLLLKEARAKAVLERLQNVEDKIIEAEMGGPKSLMNIWDHAIDMFGDRAEEKFHDLMQSLKSEKDALLKFLNKDDELIAALLNGGAGDGNADPVDRLRSGRYSLGSDPNFLKASLKLKEDFQAGIIKNEQEFNHKLLLLEISFLEARLATQTESGEDLLNLQHALQDKRIQLHRQEQERLGKLISATESPFEKEKREFEERLVALGLFNVSKESMTRQELTSMEALEREHLENIAKIKNDELKKEIEQRQHQFETELAQLQYQHARELNAYKFNAEERERITRKQQELEYDLTMKHFENLLQDLQSLAMSGQFQGADLAEILLSEDASKELQERINSILKELTKIIPGHQDNQLFNKQLKGQHYDIFGFTQEDWDILFYNLKSGKIGIDEMHMAISALGKMWSDVNKLISQGEKNKLAEFEYVNKQQQEILQSRLDRGMISEEYYQYHMQKLQAELDRKKAEYARKDAIRERNVALMTAIVNTAVAVAKSLPNLLLAAIVGAAGALQIGIISSTPLPSIPGKQSGGYIGVERSQDGKFFNAKYNPGQRGHINFPTIIAGEKGGEYMIPNEGVSNPYVRSFIDLIERHRIAGSLNSLSPSELNPLAVTAIKARGFQAGGYSESARPGLPANTSVDSGIQSSELAYLIEENRASILKLEKTNRLLFNKIKDGISVSLTGSNGFYEKDKEFRRLQGNAYLE